MGTITQWDKGGSQISIHTTWGGSIYVVSIYHIGGDKFLIAWRTSTRVPCSHYVGIVELAGSSVYLIETLGVINTYVMKVAFDGRCILLYWTHPILLTRNISMKDWSFNTLENFQPAKNVNAIEYEAEFIYHLWVKTPAPLVYYVRKLDRVNNICEDITLTFPANLSWYCGLALTDDGFWVEATDSTAFPPRYYFIKFDLVGNTVWTSRAVKSGLDIAIDENYLYNSV